MITFSCSHCGAKFRVKEELAGRGGKCPSCKRPIVAPRPVRDLAAPTGEISGQSSSLRRAGLDVTISLQGAGRHSAEFSTTSQLLTGGSRPASRYVIEKEIARGGMGAVVRAVDCDIRREVAIKYMLDQSDAGQKARFVEEAQITGQLEHPNIVPIHELGLDAEQRLFFAMKMVRGRSLAQILEGLRTSPDKEERDWPLSRLLNVLVNICNALAYAHARNVIHRDLKPANIMVGDFGEVYVMDWGLAKVVRPSDSPGANSGLPPSRSFPPAIQTANASGGAGRTQQILTSRELDGELTQDGAIVGTPSYMPPEQARGDLQTLDARADIYSIGAMLYEMLTLLPPVDREGGHVAILIRVAEGQIQPPAQRTPLRAKQGQIPKELAAIALKALSLNPTDRYPSCETLRRDIERYQEGRSVSAKQDTALELVRKLIKRNKAASLSIAAATAILLTFAAVFLKLNRDARLLAESAQEETQKAYADFQREQSAKEKVIRQSVPAMIRAGRQQANEGRVPEATQQVMLAQTYVPNDPDVHLLKGQLLLSERRFDECRVELKTVLEHRPDDEPARLLLEQLGASEPPDTVRLFALAELLKQQQLTGLAIPLLATVKAEADKKRPLVELYQKQIEANWPGLGTAIALASDGEIQLTLRGKRHIADLSPLRGMQINRIDFYQSDQIKDISPLAGMPLQSLSLSGCRQVNDITALRGMPLANLDIDGEKLVDLSPLQGVPLARLRVNGCKDLVDIGPLRGMPLRSLVINNTAVSDISALEGMEIEELDLGACGKLSDLGPLAGMPLRKLKLGGCRVTDLRPLQGMPLQKLSLDSGRVANIEPLRGLPLVDLSLYNNMQIVDLDPIRGMPLESLNIMATKVADLTPLEEMKLETIAFDPRNIRTGIEVLRNMKSLKTVILGIHKFSPAEFWQRFDRGEFK